MKIFKDKNGHEWTIDINVVSIKHVTGRLGVNLLSVVEGSELVEKLTNDPILLVDTLWVLCESQAKEKNITDEQFGRAMAGDALEQAVTALFEDLSDFFPAGKRTLLRKALEKVQTLQQMALANATKRLESGELEVLMQKLLSGSSGNLPESSASTPDLSRSNNSL